MYYCLFVFYKYFIILKNPNLKQHNVITDIPLTRFSWQIYDFGIVRIQGGNNEEPGFAGAYPGSNFYLDDTATGSISRLWLPLFGKFWKSIKCLVVLLCSVHSINIDWKPGVNFFKLWYPIILYTDVWAGRSMVPLSEDFNDLSHTHVKNT